jgi:hypothetical protein
VKRYRVEIEAVMHNGETKGYVNAAMPAISMNRAYNRATELALREFVNAGFHTVRALSSVKLEVVAWGD